MVSFSRVSESSTALCVPQWAEDSRLRNIAPQCTQHVLSIPNQHSGDNTVECQSVNLSELRELSYESRLLQCGLTTPKTRRLRGDQIEVFKIMNGYEDVDRNMFFKLKEGSKTRGHKAALVKEQCRLDTRKYSFSQRVINEWNKLPNYCVNARNVNMFINRIDRYLIRAEMKK